MRTREAKYLILIECKVEGTATGGIERPYFRTEWLLVPLLGKSIDLYQFNYQRDKIITYHGKVKGIPMSITFKFSKSIRTGDGSLFANPQLPLTKNTFIRMVFIPGKQ